MFTKDLVYIRVSTGFFVMENVLMAVLIFSNNTIYMIIYNLLFMDKVVISMVVSTDTFVCNGRRLNIYITKATLKPSAFPLLREFTSCI